MTPETATLIDISVPVRTTMPVYDKNPGVEHHRVQSIDTGDTANVSELSIGVHSGTHVDAPLHFFADGETALDLPLDQLVGEAYVVHLDGLVGAVPITAAMLEAATIPEGVTRLLLRTHDGELWGQAFTRAFARLDGSGAKWLRERGVVTVGIDYLSIGNQDAHRELLGNGVVPIEGLDLREVAAGHYWFACLPLLIADVEAAPARAVLRRL